MRLEFGELRELGKVEAALRSIVAGIMIGADRMEVLLNADVLGIQTDARWVWTLPLPERRAFREAKLRIDAETNQTRASTDLITLVAEAMVVERLVLTSPEVSLAQLAKRDGRCRTQMARLLRLSWLSPRIIEAIAEGSQPKGPTRRSMLISDMPVEWSDQERLFGFAS